MHWSLQPVHKPFPTWVIPSIILSYVCPAHPLKSSQGPPLSEASPGLPLRTGASPISNFDDSQYWHHLFRIYIFFGSNSTLPVISCVTNSGEDVETNKSNFLPLRTSKDILGVRRGPWKKRAGRSEAQTAPDLVATKGSLQAGFREMNRFLSMDRFPSNEEQIQSHREMKGFGLVREQRKMAVAQL